MGEIYRPRLNGKHLRKSPHEGQVAPPELPHAPAPPGPPGGTGRKKKIRAKGEDEEHGKQGRGRSVEAKGISGEGGVEGVVARKEDEERAR